MRPIAHWLGGLLILTLAGGCVERRYTVRSDPPGAMVYVNGQAVGQTPVDVSFVYYGTYDFLLVKDGYKPLRVQQRIAAPWYAYPPIDFAAENLYPFHIEDARVFPFKLEPQMQPNTEELIGRAGELRARGLAIEPAGKSEPPPVVEVAPPPVAAPAPVPLGPPRYSPYK